MPRRRSKQVLVYSGGVSCPKLKRQWVAAEIEAHKGMVHGDRERHQFGEQQSETIFEQAHKQGCPWAR